MRLSVTDYAKLCVTLLTAYWALLFVNYNQIFGGQLVISAVDMSERMKAAREGK